MPLPSPALDIPLDQAGRVGGPTPAAVPPLSFLERLKLGARQGSLEPDWGWNEHQSGASAYSDIVEGLKKRGYRIPETALDQLWQYGNAEQRKGVLGSLQRANFAGGLFSNTSSVYSDVWSDFAAERAKDPSFLNQYGDVHDHSTLVDHVRRTMNQGLADVQAKAPDGLGFAGFAGNLGQGLTNPINFIGPGDGAIVSTGRNILLDALRIGVHSAGVNMAVTAAAEPLVRQSARDRGIDRTFGDFLSDEAVAGGAGFVLGTAPHAIVGGARFAHDTARAILGRRAAEPVPTGTPFDSFDKRVADTFAEVVPEEQRTPDEQAAIHAIQRDAEVKASSPFVPGPAGDDAHASALDRGMAVLHGAPDAPRSVKPVARETIATPEDVADTRMPARELLKAKIHAAEAPHGGANLAGGAAFGPYQFEPRTWVSLFKRRYPKDTRSFDEIAGLRGDPHLNDVLINDLISENAAALRHAGFEESAGNLYLAHVLGHDRAVTVLRAGPEAKLGELLPPGYFKGNPFKPTDTSASLVHWAYGKMGDKAGMPEHIAAAAPDAPVGDAAAAELASATEAAPIPTGRFDVEALYGDVAMTDRPVLDPDHFRSPEDHSVAQVRFERNNDMAEGFAPVMSRAEAFAPSDHFEAVRRYQGKVTVEAIGEALGLSPGEVRHVVGSMQATDPNSPFVLTRGRPAKTDKMGNVTRKATEAGRLIRRPPRATRPNETMLEYLTRTGGALMDIDPITGKGGDLASMGGHHWHENAPFRRKLIDNEGGQSLDDAFARAIDAGYFPEHNAGRLDGGSYEDLPDLQEFRDAIDNELRGNPRYAMDRGLDVHEAARRAQADPEKEAAFYARQASEDAATRAERLFERTGHNHEAISEAAQRRGITLNDDEMVIDASDLIDAGMDPDEALDHAALGSAYRSLDQAAAETGNSSYAISPEERFADDGFPEQRGGDGGDLPPDGGGGRPESVASAAGEARGGLEEPAHDPAAGRFSDPIGDAAEAQADSVIHDLQMQERAPEGEAAPEPDSTTYRLDEEGGENDLASILDEIEQAQKAAAEMRNCLKPKGGE